MSILAQTINLSPVRPTNKPPFGLPDRDTVHVWTARLDHASDALLVLLGECLDAGESARARRFHFERDRRHFTAARGWLRCLLGRYLDVPAGEVKFGYGVRGKPFVDGLATPLRFNLSHSHGRAMFAFTSGREVGVDLEAGARLGDDWPGLVRRVFSQREQEEISALPVKEKRGAFLNGWTRKEAYLKATGLGIIDGLQSIEVTLDPRHDPTLLAGPAGIAWTFYDLRSDRNFAAALLVEGTEATEIVRLDCETHF